MVAVVACWWESYFEARSSSPGLSRTGSSFITLTTTILIVMTLVSCSLLKSTKKGAELEKHSYSKELSVRQSLNNEEVKESNSLLLRKDSGSNKFQIRIWPKGMFSFNVTNGFDGAADSVAWDGNSEEIHTTSLHQQSGLKNNTAIETSMKASSEEKAVQKKKTIESWLPIKWVLVGILVLTLVISYVLRRMLK